MSDIETKSVKDTYQSMLAQFPCTLKETSKDVNKVSTDRYMTSCEIPVVNFDAFKNCFVKNMSLTSIPSSCDALYMTSRNEFFMIEFKNGIIEALKKYKIKVKIFESLLILSEKFSQTIEFMRNNFTFILVYNEGVEHGTDQFEDTGINAIQDTLFSLAQTRKIRFGLYHFKKLYFKEVYTYSKAEFESEFVAKYCV
jgi:hypothetical protein